MDTKFRAYVGGFGSGKTFVGCIDLLNFFAKHPGTRQGYFGPSYPSIRDIFYPTFEEAAQLMGFTIVVREANKEIHVYRCGNYYGTVICRSMDNPSSIVGFKISRALCDELDVLNKEKANQAWNKIIARMRLVIPGVQNSIGVTTTPEGFRFVYEKFKSKPTKSYSMVQASTYENEKYLPPDYIDSLKETYDSSLIGAYLDGEFVNLTGGQIYNQYSTGNRSFETVQHDDKVLYIGMDFNVTKMAARVFVYRDGLPHCVDEFNELYDTADMIEHIQMRYPDRKIVVYPDASGNNRKSNAADETDIKLLKKAGFRVKAKDTNPRVKTRINSVNAMLCNSKGDRRVFVNKDTCPVTHDELEQQVYNDKGEPDKLGGKDHGNDAFGYFIVYEHGIKPKNSHFTIHG
jgi:phage terminase large subunit